MINEKGKTKKANITVTRVSPLKNSVLISIGSVRPIENWSSMARQDGDSVPYGKQEYSAVMKGMFSLDLEQAGTFATYNSRHVFCCFAFACGCFSAFLDIF